MSFRQANLVWRCYGGQKMQHFDLVYLSGIGSIVCTLQVTTIKLLQDKNLHLEVMTYSENILPSQLKRCNNVKRLCYI